MVVMVYFYGRDAWGGLRIAECLARRWLCEEIGVGIGCFAVEWKVLWLRWSAGFSFVHTTSFVQQSNDLAARAAASSYPVPVQGVSTSAIPRWFLSNIWANLGRMSMVP